MSGTGWTYTVILAFLTGIAAHGWNVYAQRTIPIGTIGVAQVAQPALAVVWAFLLLGEELVWGQAIGIAIVTFGLLAFILLNERGTRARDAEQDGRDHAGRRGLGRRAVRSCSGGRANRLGVDTIPLRDEVRRRREPFVGCVAQVHRGHGVAAPRPRSGPARRVRRPRRGPRRCAERPLEDRVESVGCAAYARPRRPSPRGGIPRARTAHRLLPTSCHALADSSAARASVVRPSARSTRPRWTRARAASRTSPVASAFSIATSSVRAPVS